MASVRVAVRVRPRNEREINLGSQFIIEMEGKQTRLTNLKIAERGDRGDHGRERLKTFTYDYSYWSVDKVAPKYASQEQIFCDLGHDVIQSAYEGYNACVFAYGQTSSGKTYTMMGNPDDVGLIPRICEGLFSRMSHETMTYRTEVSYLEIYNEKVRDLLKFNKGNTSLRVREHPSKGPYVQDLSVHTVMNFDDINELIAKGNSYRTTASTNMNDVSSRSHAIFTILFTQAKFSQDTPSETHSKLHLVDLAGSERADATGATGQRLKEGGSINKSLVTLGNVISTLADLSDKATTKGNIFIPYRDSVLTWLLKDSLGGNSKTIMIATVSPAACNYAETLSTLRYANRAKNIINKPTVNEDPNVKLIRELRNEIERLRVLLGGKMDKMTTPKVQEKLHENVARVKVLTEEWQSKWKEVADILQQEKTLAIKKEGMGVVLHSELPHLLGIEDDMLSTGIVLYHLKEGRTTIGTAAATEKQDIVLSGPELQPEHCVIDHRDGEVTLTPTDNATCTINGKRVTELTKLTQAAVILMGNTNVFRFNHPAEAAKLRQEYKGSDMNLSRGSLLSQSMTDLYRSSDNIATGWEMELKHQKQLEVLEAKRHEIKEMEDSFFKLEAERLALLETRKRQMDDMEEEAEMKKVEAEKAQKKVERDALKLKRKSQDLDRQLAALAQTQQDIKNQTQVDEDVEQKPLEEKKRNFHKLITEERENLSSLEKQLQEEAEDRSRDLNQGLEEAQTRKKKDIDKWEEERLRLQGDAKAIEEGLKQTETEIKNNTEILTSVKKQELEKVKMETEHLAILRQDFRKYDNTASQLSSSVQNNLCDEYEKLIKEQKKIKDKEKSVFEIYKQDEQELLEREERKEAELRDEWKKIEADQVYLAECEDCFRQACESGQFKNEADKEKDRAAIEAENQKIREEEKEFEQREKESRKVFAEEKKQLFDTRCKQVERLNKEKEKIKDMNTEWQALIDYCVSDREEKAATIVEQIVQDKKDLKMLEHSLEVQKKKQKECAIELENTQQVVNEISANLQEELGDLATVFDKKQKLIKVDLQGDMQKIIKRQDFLSALEDEQTDSESEADIVLERKRKAFHRYKEITKVEMENEAQKLDELQASFSSLKREVKFSKPEASNGENTQLMKKIEDVKAFEEQLKATQDQYEEERQQALDNIDYEKLKLRELEEQQRINTRVEQAVKRLLFEQRVVRDKQRRIERDKNQQAREHERAQIERAHQRELQRMREKYEANGLVSDNTPTRANPYASVMSGDAAPVSVLPSPIRQKSPEMSPSRGSLYGVKQIELIIATYDKRGSTFSPYFQYEVKLTVAGETWSISRRYSEIRDLHNQLKVKYPEVAALHFPPKRILGNILEKIASERRGLLEDYLRNMLEVLQRNPKSPLHPKEAQVYSKSLLCKFHPFFKRGVFENSRHGTG